MAILFPYHMTCCVPIGGDKLVWSYCQTGYGNGCFSSACVTSRATWSADELAPPDVSRQGLTRLATLAPRALMATQRRTRLEPRRSGRRLLPPDCADERFQTATVAHLNGTPSVPSKIQSLFQINVPLYMGQSNSSCLFPLSILPKCNDYIFIYIYIYS